MSLSQSVMDFLHFQSSLGDEPFEVIGIEHLAVAVGQGCEIEAGHGEAKSGRLKPLPVPNGLHDIHTAFGIHNSGCPPENADHLALAEAIEELAHPNDIVVLVGGERVGVIQQVSSESIDTLRADLSCRLLWQVHDRDLDIGIVGHALHGPAPGVATYVEDGIRISSKDDVERLSERTVAVEMVESEPTFLHLFRQL